MNNLVKVCIIKISNLTGPPLWGSKLYFYFMKYYLPKGNKLSAWCWMLIVHFYFDCMLILLLISFSLLYFPLVTF